MKKTFFLFYIILYNFSFSQKIIKDSNSNTIAYLKNNILLDSSHQVLYNYKGFIVFNKLSNDKNDIVLTLDIRKNKTTIFNKVETFPKWIIRNNSIIWKKGRNNINIINIKKQDDFTSFYYANNDSLIAFVDTEEITDLEMCLAFFQIWNSLNLEDLFSKETINTYTNNGDLPEGILGSMKPVNGDEFNVWYWDGKYFFPAYDNDQRYVWEFDGENLKPIWNSRMETEWTWDGEELSPFWGGHPRNNWRWEDGIFRQIFENNYKNEYEIVENIVRKRFGSFGENKWEIEGEMPLPVISLILLGIVYR